MQSDGHPGHAVRQVEYWFTYYIDSFVSSGRTAPLALAAVGAGGSSHDHGFSRPGQHARPITSGILADAHQSAWRHALVRAQRSANRVDWASVTDARLADAYFDLVRWTSAKYRVPLDSVLSALTENGFRHDSR